MINFIELSTIPPGLRSLESELKDDRMVQYIKKMESFPLERLKTMSVDSLNGYVSNSVNKYKREYPRTWPMAQKLLSDVFGLIDPTESIIQRKIVDTNNPMNFLPSAQAQQDLAFQLYCGGSNKKLHEDATRYIFAKTRIYEAIASIKSETPSQERFARWWNGVKAQYVLMKYFKDQRDTTTDNPLYEVYIPGDDSTILNSDIKNKTDFIVRPTDILDNYVLCVDAKSSKATPRVVMNEIDFTNKRPDGTTFEENLANFSRELGKPKHPNLLYAVEIRIIPSEYSDLNLTLDPQSALRKMGMLKSAPISHIQYGIEKGIYSYA